jgi:5'(3')-deoxyribonucleotidase
LLSANDIRIRIITNRLFVKYFHQQAVRQTIEWLDYHDIPYWDLCFMRDKAAVGADLYIEDAPENVEQLRADGYPTIVFSNSTNRHLPGPRVNSWEEAGRMVIEELARWKETRAVDNQ